LSVSSATVRQLSHPCFSTSDLIGTLRFYQDLLGLTVVHEFRNSEHELYGLYLSAGRSTFIEFFNSSAPLAKGTLFRHICFVVDDVTALQVHLDAAGYPSELSRGRTDRTLQFWVTDPNGIKVEFHQYDDKSLFTKLQE
jgi:catechol 2,3-dioxygenase-like lactoylglutathione lyase family enzyme